MKKLLYVGNLTHSVVTSELLDWFTPYGGVLSATVIADRQTGRCRGYGFVEMETDDQAQSGHISSHAGGLRSFRTGWRPRILTDSE